VNAGMRENEKLVSLSTIRTSLPRTMQPWIDSGLIDAEMYNNKNVYKITETGLKFLSQLKSLISDFSSIFERVQHAVEIKINLPIEASIANDVSFVRNVKKEFDDNPIDMRSNIWEKGRIKHMIEGKETDIVKIKILLIFPLLEQQQMISLVDSNWEYYKTELKKRIKQAIFSSAQQHIENELYLSKINGITTNLDQLTLDWRYKRV